MSLADVLLNGAVYALIGTIAGLMSGVLGIGGGVIVVPGLVFVFQLNRLIPDELTMYVAAGTSLAVMIFTAQSALRAHLKFGEVLWRTFHSLWPGIVLGTISGALIAPLIPRHWLEIIFAIFLYGIAIKMLTDAQVKHPVKSPSKWLNRIVSYFIGLYSGLLGVGGGVITIPYLTYCGVDTRKIAAVSNLCTFIVAIVGTVVFMITGQNQMQAIAYSTGYIYWPAVLWVAIPSVFFAPLGAKLNYLLPVKQLKYVFIVILIITATSMLF